MNFLLETIRLGLKNLLLHKLRSVLTVLGIVIGVFAVIVIVAFGEGNKAQVLSDIRRLGAQNVIIRSVKPPESTSSGSTRSRILSYGIGRRDLDQIVATVDQLRRRVPLKQVGSKITFQQNSIPQASVFGTTPELLDVTALKIARGRYLTPADDDPPANVCVIGSKVADQLFKLRDPLTCEVMINDRPFKIVGILRDVGLAGGAGAALIGRDLNFDIHIPIGTARAVFGDLNVRRTSGSFEATRVELSEIYLQADSENDVRSVAERIEAIVDKSHPNKDVVIHVPLELLEQAERTQRTLNIFLVVIASISLVVGGIGIMNIMLASVTERTREIGIRLALGATRGHIIAQFLTETTVLSGLGGMIGVLAGLGGAFALVLGHFYWPDSVAMPVVPLFWVVFSFLTALLVGIVAGLYPAVKASRQDPIVALRHD